MPDKDDVVDLGPYVDKLAEEAECKRMIEFWTKRRDKIKTELSAIMGDATEGHLNGERIVTYEPIERFRGGDYKKDFPDTYKFFSRAVSRTEFDVEWFKAQRPDEYEKYRVKVFRSTFEA